MSNAARWLHPTTDARGASSSTVQLAWTEALARSFGGKYRFERVLGRGGIGVVLAATHSALGRPVAVKMLSPHAAADADLVERFLREGRAMARIADPHVVRLFDVGRLDDGRPFLVMERLHGIDLGRLVAEQGALPPTLAVRCILHACRGLAAAHAQGIVHRDVKPSNLFLTVRSDGSWCVKIIDFGISKLQKPSPGFLHADRTAGTRVLGTPAYMAPEQMRGARDVDVRADVWSLGASLYELLTGAPAFAAATWDELRAAILDFPVPAMDRPHLRPALRTIVAMCLAKDRRHRFASATDLATALAPFAASSCDEALADTLVADDEPAVASGVRTLMRARPRRWTWLVVAVLIVLAVITAAAVATITR